MGYGSWSNAGYATYSNSLRSMSTHEVFNRHDYEADTKSGQNINADTIEYRESRDSDDHPLSTPVMVALDVTGSMEFIPDALIRDGLGVFIKDILQRKVVSDPHLLFMGIGDAVCGDRAPLQVTQFESDNRIVDQLTDIWLEKGGGGNHFESYDLAWAFAVHKTRTDAWDKRKSKGFLFTVGDEEFPRSTCDPYFAKVFSNDGKVTPISLLKAAQERWNIYHIVIEQGDYARRTGLTKVLGTWREHLGKRAIPLSDHTKLPALLTSAIALENNEPLQDVMSWWSEETQAILTASLFV